MATKYFDKCPPKEPIIIVCDELEYGWYKGELDQVAHMANLGNSDKVIARFLKRPRYEVWIALIHLERTGQLRGKLDFRLSA